MLSCSIYSVSNPSCKQLILVWYSLLQKKIYIFVTKTKLLLLIPFKQIKQRYKVHFISKNKVTIFDFGECVFDTEIPDFIWTEGFVGATRGEIGIWTRKVKIALLELCYDGRFMLVEFSMVDADFRIMILQHLTSSFRHAIFENEMQLEGDLKNKYIFKNCSCKVQRLWNRFRLYYYYFWSLT